VVTDCNALTYAINKANLNPRIARWTLALQNYNFKVVHRLGKHMEHVDALSQQICYTEALPIERELEFKQLEDSRLKEIAHNLEFNDLDVNNKFELIDGLIYRKGEDRSRFAIPDAMINNTYLSRRSGALRVRKSFSRHSRFLLVPIHEKTYSRLY